MIGHYVSIGHLKLIARPTGLSKPISGFFPDPEIRRNRASRPPRCLARTSTSTIPEPVVSLAVPEAQLAAFLNERLNVRRFAEGDYTGIRDYPGLLSMAL